LHEHVVQFNRFFEKFEEFMPRRSITKGAVEVLKLLLVKESDRYIGPNESFEGGPVDIRSFGSMISFFGPLDQFYSPDGDSAEPSIQQMRSARSVLDRIEDTCSQPWFHGDIDQREAVKRLSKRPVGSFLARFSSQPGAFTVSRVDANGGIVHARVQRDEEGKFLDGGQVFPSLRVLLEETPEECQFACPGAAFAHHFAQTRSADRGYEGQDNGYTE
jgi:SH2 domain